MSRTTKADRAERADAIAKLRDWIKPGDTVYTILDHVSSSGMSRAIRVVLPTIEPKDRTDNEDANARITRDGLSVDFLHPNYAIGRALQLRHWKRNGREQDALVMGGCGMDMGFALVYELSSVLYGGRLVKDVFLDSATEHKDGTPLTRYGAPEGYVYEGGYRCLGQHKCPSNYHVNHRDRLRCEGYDGRFCWRPNAWSRDAVPDDWPRAEPIDVGDGQSIPGPLLACLSNTGDDDQPREVCPTCKGVGDLPNPEGPERFDLVHTDGYALRHRWL